MSAAAAAPTAQSNFFANRLSNIQALFSGAFNLITSFPRFLAKEYGGMIGKFAALFGASYFAGTVGARLFARSSIRPFVLTLVNAAFPQTMIASQLLNLLTSAEVLGSAFGFAAIAAEMFDKGAIGDKSKWGKDAGKDVTKSFIEKLTGFKALKELPANEPRYLSPLAWKNYAANTLIDIGGLVGGFVGATWGTFLYQTTATAAVGAIQGASTLGVIGATAASITAVAANVGFFALGAVGSAFVLVTGKEVYDFVGGLGTGFGRQRAEDAADLANYAVTKTIINPASSVASSAYSVASTVTNSVASTAYSTANNYLVEPAQRARTMFFTPRSAASGATQQSLTPGTTTSPDAASNVTNGRVDNSWTGAMKRTFGM